MSELAETAPRVLVVDDDAGICEMLFLYLRHKGLLVRTANTAADAYLLMESESYDLAILDWKLGGADGLDLLNYFKTRFPERPVIIFTGADESDGFLKRAFEGRADAVVRKMGSLDALSLEVDRQLRRPEE